MQTHNPFRQEITQAMKAFNDTPVVTPLNKRNLITHYGLLLVSFILLSTLNTLTITWLALKFEDLQRSTTPLLYSFIVVESFLMIGLMWFTPLRQWLKNSSNRMKWE